MQTSLAKYKIGLAVLGIFSLVLVILVLTQAGAAKQDTNTYNQATSIADKLNNYTDSNGTVPADLPTVDAKAVPSTIIYKKVSDTSYRFCATYKNASNNFSAGNVETQLLFGFSSQGNNASYADNSYLLIDSAHHKGQNCQTISPSGVLPSDNSNGLGSTDSSGSTSAQDQAAALCNTEFPPTSAANDQAYSACIDKVYGTSSSTGGQLN